MSEVSLIPTPGATAIERHDRREARHEVNKERRTLRRERRHTASASHGQHHDGRRDHRTHRSRGNARNDEGAGRMAGASPCARPTGFDPAISSLTGR